MMTASELQQPQFYEPEEVQEILRIAIARKGEQEGLSREQLWEIAAELDIDPEYIQAAESDWLNQKKLNLKKQEFNLYLREELKQSIARYLIVNVFLITLNLTLVGSLSWSWYILLFWGLGISLKTWKTIQLKGKNYEQAFESWYFRQEMKRSLGNFWLWTKKTWQILTSD
ncbi:2TM domain-containing protein [Gloeocapsa sp. PCC 73106]|uniref:2TM domain-containing protein n=1 Tax=Gloeocapsa sp. PCC 73106 TaxID=102232 RepID=UPI0002AC278E|nr:2TM domain-containing protein [Gloeocapsa sp. PCC 73106]ELR97516.1 hypothetical protein GLO73106DRAFT_00013260 [Gloeocapsa sp. PCC 73106]